MRIGAIFARGSCRALKWMALFSVVFALGGGQAVAQTEVAIKSVAIQHADGKTVGENVETYVVVTLDKAVPSANDGADPPVDSGATSVAVSVVVSGLTGASTMGQAEASEDLRLANILSTESQSAPGNFDEGETVVRIPLETLNDPDAVDEKFTLTATLGTVSNPGSGTGEVTANTDPKAEEFTIDDNETQTYVFDRVGAASNIREDSAFRVNLYADPMRPASETVNLYLRLASDNSDDELNRVTDPSDASNEAANLGPANPSGGNPLSSTGGTESVPLVFAITPDENDGNRTDDPVMLIASSFNAVTGESTDIDVLGDDTITILDVHQLPAASAITAEYKDKATDGDEVDPAEVKEGEKIYLFVTLENKTDDRVSDTEEFTITPMAPAANVADVRITPAMLEVTGSGKQTTTAFTIEAIADDDINIDPSGMAILENIELTLDVAGDDDNGGGNVDPPAMSSIGIEDVTPAQVSVAEGAYAHITEEMGDDPLNPDDEFSLMTSELFTYDETMYDVSFGVSVSGAGVSASSGGDMVTVMASGVTPADGAKVTVTASATPKASSLVITQTQDNVAQVTFPVVVVLSDLTVTVMADPMVIDEGGVSMITAMASRMVDDDDGVVTVNLQVVGDATLSADSITINAGSDSGSVELTATEDMDYDDETVTVVASGAVSDTITIEVMDNDMAPPETTYTLTASADSVMEGGEVEINVEASQAVAENTEIMLVHGAGSASADDYTVEMLMIEAGSSAGGATLMATDDSDVEGDETLTLNGMMGNVVVDSVMLTITDNDEAPVVEPTVRAKDGAAMMIADAISTAAGDADWMVGGMVATVDMSMLFDVDDGVTADYSGTSSDESVVSATTTGGTMLALTPMSAGMATITVTGADRAGGGTASVMHDATVALQTLVLTVTADSMAIDEGGSAMITASANRAVTMDTTLSLTVTGDSAAVSVPEMLTIEMGSDSGMAEVMAVEDGDTMNAEVSVVVSGAGLASPVTFGFSITDNDRTVNALTQAEVDAVFTVAIAMAAGGADGWVPGGGAAEVDLSALFMTESGATIDYMAESSDADTVMASADGMNLMLTPMATGVSTISVTATDTSGDADDTAMVSSIVTVGVLPLEIMVSPTTAEVEEGGTVDITATANKMVDANVEVMLIRDAASSAGEDDFSLEPALITIMAGEATGMATLTATDDYDVEGNESLTLVARVKDHGDVGTVMVSIMEAGSRDCARRTFA